MQRMVTFSTPDEGVWVRPKERRVVLDTREAISLVRSECERYGEISAVDFNDPQELDMFMYDFFSQCEYYPAGYTNEHLRKTIDVCLTNFEEHTRYKFTSMQRYLWWQVAIEIVSQSFTFGLRDTCFVSIYTYSSMLGDNIVLRPYE